MSAPDEEKPRKKRWRPGNVNRRPSQWQLSQTFAAIGAKNLAWFRAHRHEFPQCTATAKSSGKRCGQLALEGRTVCRWHGGLTPRGEQHGKRQLRPKPPRKQTLGDWRAAEAKLLKWQRQDHDRVRRLRAMSDAEFWRYIARMGKRIGDPMSPIFNRAVSEEKARRGPDPRRALNSTDAAPPPVSAEVQAIEEKIAALRAELAAHETSSQPSRDDEPPKYVGVFE